MHVFYYEIIIDTETDLKVKLVVIPQRIELKLHQSMAGGPGVTYCHSINWTISDDILCGTSEGLILHNRENLLVTGRSSTSGDVHDVHELKKSRKLICLKGTGARRSIEEFDAEMNRIKTLCALNGAFFKLSISPREDRMIAITNAEAKLYTINGKHKLDIDLGKIGITQARAVHMLSSCHLLVLNENHGLYKITAENHPVVIWKCAGLGTAHGFCVCGDLIYVTPYYGNLIRVISLEGTYDNIIYHHL